MTYEKRLCELAHTAISLDAYSYGEYNHADSTVENSVRAAEKTLAEFSNPKAALLVAEVLAAARELRHELEDFDAEARVRIQEFDKAIEALDAHHEEEKA